MHNIFADSLLFAWVGSQRFDSEIKFWRLFADVINDVGLTLELASPYFGRYFLLVILALRLCSTQLVGCSFECFQRYIATFEHSPISSPLQFLVQVRCNLTN